MPACAAKSPLAFTSSGLPKAPPVGDLFLSICKFEFLLVAGTWALGFEELWRPLAIQAFFFSFSSTLAVNKNLVN